MGLGIDFFDPKFVTEDVRKDKCFGICDPAGGICAYTATDIDGSDVWCAEVSNPDEKELQFVPVDNNMVFYDEQGNKEKSCDGMLYMARYQYLCFIELKDKRKQWISEAVSQLATTIKRFNETRDYRTFVQRHAYACNRRHRMMQSSNRQEMQDFMRATHFTLHVQDKIEIN